MEKVPEFPFFADPSKCYFYRTFPSIFLLFLTQWHPQICGWHMSPSIFYKLNPPHLFFFFVQYSNAYILSWLLQCIYFDWHPALPSVFSAFPFMNPWYATVLNVKCLSMTQGSSSTCCTPTYTHGFHEPTWRAKNFGREGQKKTDNMWIRTIPFH